MFNNYFTAEKIEAVAVYLEHRKTREYVGLLNKNEKSEFQFVYDERYIYSDSAMSLGPELPLTKITHTSKNLFKSIGDRIPSRENPAYVEYCAQAGISPTEENPIILLATIGKRGPSSFVFEPKYKLELPSISAAEYRKYIGLTIREFSQVFGISARTIQKLESGDSVSSDVERRIGLYIIFPDTGLFEIMMHGGSLIPEKKSQAIARITELIDECEKSL